MIRFDRFLDSLLLWSFGAAFALDIWTFALMVRLGSGQETNPVVRLLVELSGLSFLLALKVGVAAFLLWVARGQEDQWFRRTFVGLATVIGVIGVYSNAVLGNAV